MAQSSELFNDDDPLKVYNDLLGQIEVVPHVIPNKLELLEERLKKQKARLEVIIQVLYQAQPRAFTSGSINFFATHIRLEILKTVLEIPDEKDIQYIGAKEPVKESLGDAIFQLNSAVDHAHQEIDSTIVL